MPAPLVASPGVSPEVASAFNEGARTGASAYQTKINEDIAAQSATDAQAEQVAAEDRALKNTLAIKAYEFQQRAAQTKQLNAVEWNKAHWDNVTGTYLANLAEKQANAETWLNPQNINNITPQSRANAREVVDQVRNIYQHVANNTPVDFSAYHEPASVINAKPFTAAFQPEFTDQYRQELTDKATVEHNKAVKGENGDNLTWLEKHNITRQDRLADDNYTTGLAERKDFDKKFAASQINFSSAYGALQSLPKKFGKDDLEGPEDYTKKSKALNEAAADFSSHLGQIGDVYPEFSGVASLWNRSRGKYNGLSTYKDIDKFMNEQSAKAGTLPEGSSERKATVILHSLVYGKGAGR